jgi:hypothetical protein
LGGLVSPKSPTTRKKGFVLKKIVIKAQPQTFNPDMISLMQVLFPECEIEVVFEEVKQLEQHKEEAKYGEYSTP